jgi:hypothetical protein
VQIAFGGLGYFFWAGLIWWKAREPILEPDFYVIICSKPGLGSNIVEPTRAKARAGSARLDSTLVMAMIDGGRSCSFAGTKGGESDDKL